MNNKLTIGLIGIAIILIYFTINPIKKYEQPKMEIHKPTITADTVRIDMFSEANLILYMHELCIKSPNIVLAQAKLETANFTSYLFITSNNLFGFRGWKGYYKYKNWKYSVLAYKNWQDKKYNGGDYYVFLKNINYAEDSLYIHKLKQFKNV